MDYIEALEKLIGKVIVSVEGTECDEGFAITLDDGSIIYVCFSGDEGEIKIATPNSD